jgi:hypothetical protein
LLLVHTGTLGFVQRPAPRGLLLFFHLGVSCM